MADKNDGPSRRTQIGDGDGSLRTASLLDRLASPEVFWPLFFVAAIAGAAVFFLTSPSGEAPAARTQQTVEAQSGSAQVDPYIETGNLCPWIEDLEDLADCRRIIQQQTARSVQLRDPCERVGETGFVDLEVCLFRRYSEALSQCDQSHDFYSKALRDLDRQYSVIPEDAFPTRATYPESCAQAKFRLREVTKAGINHFERTIPSVCRIPDSYDHEQETISASFTEVLASPNCSKQLSAYGQYIREIRSLRIEDRLFEWRRGFNGQEYEGRSVSCDLYGLEGKGKCASLSERLALHRPTPLGDYPERVLEACRDRKTSLYGNSICSVSVKPETACKPGDDGFSVTDCFYSQASRTVFTCHREGSESFPCTRERYVFEGVWIEVFDRLYHSLNSSMNGLLDETVTGSEELDAILSATLSLRQDSAFVSPLLPVTSYVTVQNGLSEGALGGKSSLLFARNNFETNELVYSLNRLQGRGGDAPPPKDDEQEKFGDDPGDRRPRPARRRAPRPEDTDRSPRAARSAPAVPPEIRTKAQECARVGQCKSVPVLFGTNRVVRFNQQLEAVNRFAPTPTTPFTSDNAGELILGEIMVSVPATGRRRRDRGEVSRPWTIPGTQRLGNVLDPYKHFVLYDYEEYSRSGFGNRISKVKKAFVYVHGFNMPMKEAAMRAAQMKADAGFDGEAMIFSWPTKYIELARARTNLENYEESRRRAKEAQRYFEEFISLIKSKTDAAVIHVVAHSMGAQIVVPAAANMVETRPPAPASRLQDLVLVAPDVDGQVFRQQITAASQQFEYVTLYGARSDWALSLSRRACEERLGASRCTARAGVIPEEGPLLGNEYEFIAVSEMESWNGLTNHSPNEKIRDIVNDIGELLEFVGRRPSSKRSAAFQRQPFGAPPDAPRSQYYFVLDR